MKYVIIRCEDIASPVEGLAALLEGARLPHLQQLAQAGAVGLMRQAGTHRLRAHRALFGLGPDDHEASAERCYAAGANLQLAEGETAWCCEFVSTRDGVIVDPTAGRIRTKESEVLIQALDEQLGSDTRRWEVGRDAQHLLITTEPSLRRDGAIGVPPPEMIVGLPWKRYLPKNALGVSLSTLIEDAAKLLESHPINRVRVDLGENPANLLWLWGGVGGESAQPSWSARTGLAGAVISNGFMVRGLALALGLEWKNGPSSIEETPLAHVLKTVAGLLERHDLVYVHLSIESHDPVERLCAMERIDQLLLKPLTESLPRLGSWRLLAAVDNRMSDGVPLIGIGTGLAPQPSATLATARLAESGLTFEDGPAFFAWLTRP